MALPSYTVWFRGKPACPCLVEWLPAFEAELIRRGVIRESIDIAQLIGGAEASAGTHTKGGVFDIWQHDPVTIWVARQMGADATWARITGSFEANRHAHGVLTGCQHNGPALYQIDEVRAGGDGLLGSTPDPGPRPLSGRTWREGIAWAKQLQEDEVTPEDIDKIAEAVSKRILDSEIKMDDEGRTAPLRRVLRWTSNGVQRLVDGHKDEPEPIDPK
jgi:hypothetical protein